VEVGVCVPLLVNEPDLVLVTLDAPLGVPETVFEFVTLFDPVTEFEAETVTDAELEPVTVTVVVTVTEFVLLDDG